MAVFDLHVHTVRGSSDSSLTPGRLVERARALGLDGVCLTEHSGGWDSRELDRVFGDSGVTVVGGLEVETDMGHVLVFGMRSYVEGMHRARDLRMAVDDAGGVMVSAHPFRNLLNEPPYNDNLLFPDPSGRPTTVQEAAGHPLFEIVDDVEVANGANSDTENRFALDVARYLGKKGTGGSDAHSDQGLGRFVTVLDGDVRTEADLIEALRAGAFSPGQGLQAGEPAPFGLDNTG